MIYTSASTFLTLGLGDVTSPEPIGRTFVILEAGSGFIFLGLMISYMPLLDQAYSSREVGNQLIHSRAGRPPSGIKFLLRYADAGRSEHSSRARFARPSAGWPRSCRAIFPIRCCRSTGHSGWVNRGWFL